MMRAIIKEVAVNILCGIAVSAGIILAYQEGEWFPWANIVGICLFGGGLMILQQKEKPVNLKRQFNSKF